MEVSRKGVEGGGRWKVVEGGGRGETPLLRRVVIYEDVHVSATEFTGRLVLHQGCRVCGVRSVRCQSRGTPTVLQCRGTVDVYRYCYSE